MPNNDTDHRCMIAPVAFLFINKERHDTAVFTVGHAFYVYVKKVAGKGVKKPFLPAYSEGIFALEAPVKPRFSPHIIKGFIKFCRDMTSNQLKSPP